MSDSNRGERSQDLGQSLAILATIILCCVVVAVVTFASARNSTNRDQRADYYQAEAERNQKAICVGRQGALLAECLEEQRRASRDAYTAEQDLKAQRDMSLWALWVFIVSAITALLTLWALWFVRRTLLETQRMAGDTRDMARASWDATDAMVRQNKLTEQAQRPWVSIELQSHAPYQVDEKGFATALVLHLKNVGSSPAMNVRLCAKCFITKAEAADISNLIGTVRSQHNPLSAGPFLLPGQTIEEMQPVNGRFESQPDGLFEIEGRTAFMPIAVVIVTYCSVEKPETLFTSVGYMMGKTMSGGTGGAIFVDEGNLAREQSVITSFRPAWDAA